MDQRFEQALRTLRAIRQRYEAGHELTAGYVSSYTVQVALGHSDMLWIAAAIEALEKLTSREPQRNGTPLTADSSGRP